MVLALVSLLLMHCFGYSACQKGSQLRVDCERPYNRILHPYFPCVLCCACRVPEAWHQLVSLNVARQDDGEGGGAEGGVWMSLAVAAREVPCSARVAAHESPVQNVQTCG